jgi:hypothetical protein
MMRSISFKIGITNYMNRRWIHVFEFIGARILNYSQMIATKDYLEYINRYNVLPRKMNIYRWY